MLLAEAHRRLPVSVASIKRLLGRAHARRSIHPRASELALEKESR
jgi:hypothetical protein